MNVSDPLAAFTLTEIETLTLEVKQLALMWNDCQLDGDDRSTQYFKRLVIQDYATSIGRKLAADEGSGAPIGRLRQALEECGGDPDAAWIDQVHTAVSSNTLPAWLELVQGGDALEGLSRQVVDDARAALMVIESGLLAVGCEQADRTPRNPMATSTAGRRRRTRFSADEDVARLAHSTGSSAPPAVRCPMGNDASATIAGGVAVGAATGNRRHRLWVRP